MRCTILVDLDMVMETCVECRDVWSSVISMMHGNDIFTMHVHEIGMFHVHDINMRICMEK